MNEPIHRKWASAYFNGDFFVIVSNSGYRSCVRDPNSFEGHLTPDATEEELGKSLLQAIGSSRFLKPDEIDEFFNLNRIMKSDSDWIASLLDRYKKSKRNLFKNMALCNVTVTTGEMEISPMRHEKLDAWGREKDDGIEDIILQADSPPEEIGRSLRIAFSRCR
jgi:CDI immunity protein